MGGRGTLPLSHSLHLPHFPTSGPLRLRSPSRCPPPLRDSLPAPQTLPERVQPLPKCGAGMHSTCQEAGFQRTWTVLGWSTGTGRGDPTAKGTGGWIEMGRGRGRCRGAETWGEMGREPHHLMVPGAETAGTEAGMRMGHLAGRVGSAESEGQGSQGTGTSAETRTLAGTMTGTGTRKGAGRPAEPRGCIGTSRVLPRAMPVQGCCLDKLPMRRVTS